jgi:hypothetical protein
MYKIAFFIAAILRELEASSASLISNSKVEQLLLITTEFYNS